MSGTTYTNKRYNAHCADYPSDTFSATVSHNGRDLELEMTDSSGAHGREVSAMLTLSMDAALALRDFLNTAYPDAAEEGEQLFYVIGMNPRTPRARRRTTRSNTRRSFWLAPVTWRLTIASSASSRS